MLEFLFKKRLQHRCFSAKFTKFLRTPILKNVSEWMLQNQFQSLCLAEIKEPTLVLCLRWLAWLN